MRPPSPKITNSHLAIMANYRPLPPLEKLHELFLLDPSSPSGLRRKVTVASSATAGSVAGSPTGNGYWYICIDGKKFQAHRITYFMYHGLDPRKGCIDHKDGNPSNNSIDNLRLVDQSINRRNAKTRIDNALGCRGVFKKKDHFRTKPYMSYIKSSSGKLMCKYFEILEDAIEQRKAWEAEYFPGIYLRED